MPDPEEKNGLLQDGLSVSDIRIVETQATVPQPDESGFVADSPRHAEYEDRIVAFVDVLGFKDIIFKSAGKPDLVRKIHHALTVSNDAWAEVFAKEVGLDMTANDFEDRMTSFSDCVVISVKPDIREIGLLVYIIFRICRQLLMAGFLSRGGVAKGLLYHEDGATSGNSGAPMVFGPAFVNAYLFESTHADGPRVILENSVREHIRRKCLQMPETKLTAFLNTHIKRAEDGPAYIDIFADFGANDYYETAPDVSSEIETIHGHLCAALDQTADRPLHFKKNAQLARQFNHAVERVGRVDFHIDGDRLPTRDS
ncbi:hypothetical protein [Burkholderia plantarii]|uniref:hypothetical protein n=1 Tax=Burkholderia plantarii TaxID=41899 RepID=UPI0007064C41|nr:hypothetical protein [Burkholderia plantarii]ALK29030.1 hypothetical protein bpln_1g01990 [Burkholderia plantarii]